MAISRKLIAHDQNEDMQWLKVDHSKRYIENLSPEWQFLFGPNSSLSASNQIIKIACKFDQTTLDSIKLAAYLYDMSNASIGNAGTCTFKIYSISGNDWTESLIHTVPGDQLSNLYYYSKVLLTDIPQVRLDGGDSIMIEATITRLSEVYRNRIYVNHLGVYDSIFRLRNDVEYLDISKLDE